jgi:hypothetical protein
MGVLLRGATCVAPRFSLCLILFGLTGCGGLSTSRAVPVPVRGISDCISYDGHARSAQNGKRTPQLVCDGSSDFGGPLNGSDPTIGIYNDPGPGTPPPPVVPPLVPPPAPAPPRPPFAGGPIPGAWDPLWVLPDASLSFVLGPRYDQIGSIAAGSITDVSIGISTAGSDYLNPIPTAGHLYVQLWSFGAPIGPPLQAGDINGKLAGANFSQDVFGQPHVYLDGTNFSLAVLSANLARHADAYARKSSCWPDYSVSMNSNSWIDGLLLSAGVSQDVLSSGMLRHLRTKAN